MSFDRSFNRASEKDLDNSQDSLLSEVLHLGLAQQRPEAASDQQHWSVRSNEIGMTGTGGAIERAALVTGQGLLKSGGGMVETVRQEGVAGLAITAVESAAVGLGLKLVLNNAAPVAKIATLALGTLFVAQTAPKYYQAYSGALEARSWEDMDHASSTFGRATGELMVNTLVGAGGYKLGSGIVNKFAARPALSSGALEATTPEAPTPPASLLENAGPKRGTNVFESLSAHDQMHGPIEQLSRTVLNNHQNLIARIDQLGDQLPRIAFHGPTGKRAAIIDSYYGLGDAGVAADKNIFIASPKTISTDAELRLADMANSHSKANSYRHPGQPLYAFDMTGTIDRDFMTKRLTETKSSVGAPFMVALDSYEANMPLSRMSLLKKIPTAQAEYVQPDPTAPGYQERVKELSALHIQSAIDAVLAAVEAKLKLPAHFHEV
ncbi:MAG: hypothetical protein JSS83_13885 [Cyanobacteria bacterium SZAS LIN-3]|nr:hypothetical protein [Cyanobacteria bacterium SZAS LIN-3]